ncbi:MAG TPA: ABC transporter permease [Longimicrobium sp.]|nr:ABC transporter permease [Longimicrobium sp.]
MGWTKRWIRRLRALVRKDAVEAELDEELAFHLEQEVQKNLRAGMEPAEARRQAALSFGGVEKFKEEVRDARRLGWAYGMSLDFKLGFRMLLKYPGLTLVGGLAFAFAIAIGAAYFEFSRQFIHPRLPLPDGDRIVAVRNWDAAAGRAEPRALHDFATWRAELRSVEELGAFRTLERNLVAAPGGRGVPVVVAEISASAFRVIRVPPLLGRALVETDEREGAPPVVVIGHEAWRTRFGGDPAVVGRTVRLGSTQATVVGVMPEGFGFPIAQGFWTPLRLDAVRFERGEGPAISVFGRLAPGATLGQARTELATLGRRAAADFPVSNRHLRPQVVPYAESLLNMSADESAGLMASNLLLVPLLVLACANVALLLFARAATREGEIVVRSALGASRGRIVLQLFTEALVLGGAAALAGLAAAALVLRWGMGAVKVLIGDEFPFWLHATLSPATVLYACALTLLGAAVAGVAPALKVTRGLGARLRQQSAGGGGLRFGGVWTAVIVAQVAVTVAVPVQAFFIQRHSAQLRSLDVGVPAEEYLSARLEMDREDAPADTSRAALAARFAAAYGELERRLAADPEVAGVTLASLLPGMDHPGRRIEVEGGRAVDPDSALLPCHGGAGCASSAAVAANYFEVMGAPVLSGRAFHAGDLASGARVAIANRSFIDRVLGGRNPVGRRVRYVEPKAADAEPGPWHEIVGVVPDLGTSDGGAGGGAGLYHPLAPGAAHPVHLAVRVRGEPESFAPRLQSAATAADPTLRIHELAPLDEVRRSDVQWLAFLFRLTVTGVAVAVLLSLAGIYAVMSFTVARRTREIGIRVALGADARRVILAVFARPLTQIGLGIAAGGVLVGAGLLLESRGAVSPKGAALFVAYAALMLGVCLLACIVPTRRALGIEPTEALRADT